MKRVLAIVLLGLVLSTVALDVQKKGDDDEEKSERDGEHEREEEDHDGFRRKREFKISYDEEKINFESKTKTEDGENKVDFDLRAEGNSPMRFRLKFESKNGENKTHLNFRVSFLKIVEFLENSTDFDGFNGTTKDTLVGEEFFGRSDWTISAPEITATLSGGKRYKFTISYKTFFQMVVFMADSEYEAHGTNFSAVQVKLDVIIKDYPYKAENNETYLALLCAIQSAYEFERRGHDDDDDEHAGTDDDGHKDEHEVKRKGADAIYAGDFALAFGWDGVLQADGKDVDVVVGRPAPRDADSDAHGDEREKAKAFFFSFNAKHPNELVWDPYVGAAAVGAGSVAALALPLLMLFAAFAALF